MTSGRLPLISAR